MRSLTALALLVAAALLLSACQESRAQAPPNATMGQNMVVLELFTSQGCSSCPSADAVLRDLGKDPNLQGKVLPLSFHVDYWNYLGWADPFSSPRWSNRQRDYGKAFQTDRIYTPQLVVAGRTHLVGSRRAQALDEIRAASLLPPGGQVQLSTAWGDKDALKVELSASRLADPSAPEAVAWVIVFENNHSVRVTRGENTGEQLQHDYVVRHMERAFALKPGAKDAKTLTLTLDPSWKADQLGVAVLLQEPTTMKILAAAHQPLPRPGLPPGPPPP
jgi:hypothetical protein